MTTIITATSLKDVPKVARVYYVGVFAAIDPASGVVAERLAAYEKKYNRVPETAVIYKQYLYVEEEKK